MAIVWLPLYHFARDWPVPSSFICTWNGEILHLGLLVPCSFRFWDTIL